MKKTEEIISAINPAKFARKAIVLILSLAMVLSSVETTAWAEPIDESMNINGQYSNGAVTDTLNTLESSASAAGEAVTETGEDEGTVIGGGESETQGTAITDETTQNAGTLEGTDPNDESDKASDVTDTADGEEQDAESVDTEDSDIENMDTEAASEEGSEEETEYLTVGESITDNDFAIAVSVTAVDDDALPEGSMLSVSALTFDKDESEEMSDKELARKESFEEKHENENTAEINDEEEASEIPADNSEEAETATETETATEDENGNKAENAEETAEVVDTDKVADDEAAVTNNGIVVEHITTTDDGIVVENIPDAKDDTEQNSNGIIVMKMDPTIDGEQADDEASTDASADGNEADAVSEGSAEDTAEDDFIEEDDSKILTDEDVTFLNDAELITYDDVEAIQEAASEVNDCATVLSVPGEQSEDTIDVETLRVMSDTEEVPFGSVIALPLDISLVSEDENGEITDIQPEGKVEVRITLPEAMRECEYVSVFHSEDDGTVTKMDGRREGDDYIFLTEHFSAYTVLAENFEVLNKNAGATTLNAGYYKVPASTTVTYAATGAGQSGLTINGTVCIYLSTKSVLKCTGKAGTGKDTPGGAGVRLESGKVLYLCGSGKLQATGGKAADGGKGAANGSDACINVKSDWYQSGSGGAGGAGGAGAGAGIGGIGGKGGAGGAGGASVRCACEDNHQSNGADGAAGSKGSNGNAMGTLYVLDTVSVTATAGSNGNAGGTNARGMTRVNAKTGGSGNFCDDRGSGWKNDYEPVPAVAAEQVPAAAAETADWINRAVMLPLQAVPEVTELLTEPMETER